MHTHPHPSPITVADGLSWITHTCACPHAHTLNQSPWPKTQGYELEGGLMTGPPPSSLGLQACRSRCVLHLQRTAMALIVWLGAHAHPKAIPWWRERSCSMSVSTLVQEDRAAQPPHKAWEWGGMPLLHRGNPRNAGSPMHCPSLSPSRPGGRLKRLSSSRRPFAKLCFPMGSPRFFGFSLM